MQDGNLDKVLDMIVLGVSRQFAFVCGDLIVKRFDVAILKGCHQRCGLEHGSRVGSVADRHVVNLVQTAVFRTFGQVHHRADGAGPDIHEHGAAILDLRVGGHLLPHRLVNDVLKGYVKGCPDIQAVHRLDVCAVVVLDLLLVVGRLEPDLAFLAVQDIVIFAFYADVAAALLVLLLAAVVLDVTDCASGQCAVRVFSAVMLLDDDPALVPALLHKRKALQLQKSPSVKVCEKLHVPFPLVSAFDDHPVVLVGVDSCLGGEAGRESPRLAQPVVLKAVRLPWILLAHEILLEHGTVHVKIVHRS